MYICSVGVGVWVCGCGWLCVWVWVWVWVCLCVCVGVSVGVCGCVGVWVCGWVCHVGEREKCVKVYSSHITIDMCSVLGVLSCVCMYQPAVHRHRQGTAALCLLL